MEKLSPHTTCLWLKLNWCDSQQIPAKFWHCCLNPWNAMESVCIASLIYTHRNLRLSFSVNFFQGNMACCHRGNAILVSLSPWGWRSRAPSLIDFLLPKKERTRRWGLVGNRWCAHAWHLQVCQTTRLSYSHRHPCLVPVFCALLVSGPKSNIMLNVQRNPLYFLSFLFFLEPHWCCSSSAVSCQTMRACLFILQFPAFHSPLPWSNKRNSLKELSAWLLSEGEKQI